jgi:hypothetical protein
MTTLAGIPIPNTFGFVFSSETKHTNSRSRQTLPASEKFVGIFFSSANNIVETLTNTHTKFSIHIKLFFFLTGELCIISLNQFIISVFHQ